MTCCNSSTGTDHFFSKYAGRYAKRFTRKGPDRPSRILIDELSKGDMSSTSVLDIGCGVGDVHLTLLERGAASATGVDLSQGMLEQAARLAKERGVGVRARYVHGDLVAVTETVGPADIVVLDKVVCCYADPGTLIRESAGKARKCLALSYPRASWMASVGFRFLHWLGRSLHWSFHPYYHQPSLLEQTVERSGFREAFSDNTMIWQLKIYART